MLLKSSNNHNNTIKNKTNFVRLSTQMIDVGHSTSMLAVVLVTDVLVYAKQNQLRTDLCAPWPPQHVPNSLYGLCGRKATLTLSLPNLTRRHS